MVQRRGTRQRPADYLVAGSWPEGTLVHDAPAAARYAQHISRVLAKRLAAENVSDVARRTGIARSTLRRICDGLTWGDVVTLAKLEQELNVRLWPE